MTQRTCCGRRDVRSTQCSNAGNCLEWGVIGQAPCSIKLLKAPKNEASFHFEGSPDREAPSQNRHNSTAVLVVGAIWGFVSGADALVTSAQPHQIVNVFRVRR